MARIIKVSLIVAWCLLILSCKEQDNPRMLMVEHPIKVYKTYEGDSLNYIFTLEPGDKCAIGREKVQKVFAYLEIVCPGKGYGWIIKESGYKIIDRYNVSQISK